jgi:hypothetical protein
VRSFEVLADDTRGDDVVLPQIHAPENGSSVPFPVERKQTAGGGP